MPSIQTYLLPLLAFSLSFWTVRSASSYSPRSISIAIEFYESPYGSLPVPGRPDKEPLPLPFPGSSDLVIVSDAPRVELHELKGTYGRREVTYLAGVHLFDEPLPITMTAFSSEESKEPGVKCELLEPDLSDLELVERQLRIPTEVIRMTREYPNIVPSRYEPWYKWSRGILCIQFPQKPAE